MKNPNKKCTFKDHKEIDANSYCLECKAYMCNKCEIFHSKFVQNHNTYTLDKDITEIFTGLCKEQKHNDELEYFCKTHNELCCAACLCKIKKGDNGKHKDCDACIIEDIKSEKLNKLKENIKYLEEISNTFEDPIDKIKKFFEKINEEKEVLKLKVQKIFTKIRNELNNREDELLSEIDKRYDEIYFKEEIIKESEKLPNKIKLSLEKGKMLEKEYNNDKLVSLINDCINIENNVKNINIIQENVKKCNDLTNIKIDFFPKEEGVNEILNVFKKFGQVADQNDYGLFKFQWENHDNCELSNKNKKIKKIKNKGWNTNIKGNKILRKNMMNTFKIRVNNIDRDKSGLSFGLARVSCNFSSDNLYCEEWNFNCSNFHYNSKLKSFKNEQINKNDIITFIVDLNKGSLSVKKNDNNLGTIYDIPKNEDLIPCISIYYVGNEIEIID